jgi:DNA-binding transcriptional LysR family regulator
LPVDVDLRKLRYFVAVAEHLHFGRAAEELHIAQPVLSRQIKALEHELKVQLLVRDRRSTELTAAGEQLLTDARPLLAGAEATRRRVVRAARGGDSFTVGFMPGLIVTGPVRELTRRHPDLAVEVVRTGWHDQAEVIHDGRVDVGYVRLPVDERGLALRPLLTEPRVAVLPVDHRLAGEDAVTLADLADERLLQDRTAVPEWTAVSAWATAPEGSAAPPGPERAPGRGAEREPEGDLNPHPDPDPEPDPEPSPGTRRPITGTWTVEEKLEHVAAGHGIVVLPLSTATFYTRPDVTRLPISGIAPNQVCLAWAAGRRTPMIQEFVSIALDHESHQSLTPPAAQQH